MKISDPFGFDGFVEVNGEYTVGKKTGRFSSSSPDAEANVPIPWKPDEPFDVALTLSVEYKLRGGATDVVDGVVSPMGHIGFGSFGMAAKWRANLSEDGLELKGRGAAPSGSSKGSGDIAVAASNARTSESSLKDKKPYVEFEIT